MAKVDEIPFDFQRRRLSVVVDPGDGTHLMITKGAVEEILRSATAMRWAMPGGQLDEGHFEDAERRDGAAEQ
jgi:Mg2+-importing ATPase